MAISRRAAAFSADANAHPRAQFVQEFVERNGATLMHVARRYCATATDAEDVFQRTLELLLTKAPDGDEQRLLAWAQTVIRNEAHSEWRRGAKLAPATFDDYADSMPSTAVEPEERVADIERLGQGREALQRIKIDQLRCLLLRADGLDYVEIGEITGFSYAKVNRCLSEGRKAFRDRLERIDSGAECRRLEGVLSMMADGQAAEASRVDAELHLRNCLHCQSTLREFASTADRIAVLFPVGLISIEAVGEAGRQSRGPLARLSDAIDSGQAWIQNKLADLAPAHQSGEMALAKKASIVAAVSASLIAGGVVADRATQDGQADRQAANAGIPSPHPLEVVPIKPVSKRPRSASRSSRSRKAREASESYVVGKRAGTRAARSTADPTTAPGSSLGNGQDFNAPAVASPADPAGGGSSADLSELAP